MAVSVAVTFSDELWDSAADVYDAVRAHPFLTGLTDGTLPHDAFGSFVTQDSHYLRGYARALAVLAARAPTEDDTTLFAQHAAGAIAAEQEMHAELMVELRSAGSPELSDALSTDRRTPPTPTTLAYTSYLLATVYGGSFAEGLGAVLPCYWIYARVGEALLAASSPDPLYARWIGMYGGDEFQAVVDAAVGVMDRVAGDLAPAERARVVDHYRTTSRYEWMFWDAAWRGETWPV